MDDLAPGDPDAPRTGRPQEPDGAIPPPCPLPGRVQGLLDSMARAGEGETVTLRDVLDAVGTSSFGALLLVPGLVIVSPLSGIPGVPTLAGIVIFLICVQYIAGRDRIWLPDRILRVTLRRNRVEGALRRIRPLARVIDRLVQPRFTFVINRASTSTFAAVCALLALTLPPLEALPFVATTTAFIICLFGFALLAEDGLLGIAALVATAGAVAGATFLALPHLAGLFP
jgi:hypothetical protein